MSPSPAERSPESVLWRLHRAVEESYSQAHPIRQVIMLNFAELLTEPEFLNAPSFALMLQHYAAASGLALLVSIDTETWEGPVRENRIPNVLPTFDVTLTLRSESRKDPSVVAKAAYGNVRVERRTGDDGFWYLASERLSNDDFSGVPGTSRASD